MCEQEVLPTPSAVDDIPCRPSLRWRAERQPWLRRAMARTVGEAFGGQDKGMNARIAEEWEGRRRARNIPEKQRKRAGLRAQRLAAAAF
jgi:hypothetical protein